MEKTGLDPKRKNRHNKSPAQVAKNVHIQEMILQKIQEKKLREKQTSEIPIFTFTFDSLKRIFLSENSITEEPKKTKKGSSKPNSLSTSTKEFESSPTKPEKVKPDNFDLIALIGKGSFGEVYLVNCRDNNKHHAMKVLYKQKIFSKIVFCKKKNKI